MPSEVKGRSFSLGSDEELGAGLKRVAAGRAEQALERLRRSAAGELDAAGAVHGARKDLKKLRSVLRLLRDRLPQDTYAAENARYRDAARGLSAARDAEVKLATLEALAARSPALPGEAVEAWQQVLERDRRSAAETAPDAQAVARLIEPGLTEIRQWPLEGDSWSLIGGGLGRSYRRGLRAMEAAAAEPSEAAFHRWRKRAKDLWYALRLLSGAWPAVLDPLAEEAHRLTERLGDHHDLAVLREDLQERRLGEEDRRALEAVIEERQRRLAGEAFELGRRLYAERPKAFSRRLRRYRRAWRG